eukprot:GHVS01079264.1.p1 GENE.GHVS01079264.1~~GHVS01079264.1.p1  ORF type:complete len:697 (+),score=136.91 GHVS01079264.1:45-2135(+)
MESEVLSAEAVGTLDKKQVSELHQLLLSRQEDLSRQEQVLDDSRLALGEQTNKAREALVCLAQSLLNEAHQKLKGATAAERQRLQSLVGRAEEAVGGLAARRREWRELINRCQEQEKTILGYNQRIKSEQRRNRQLQQRLYALEEDKARLSELLTVLPQPARQQPPSHPSPPVDNFTATTSPALPSFGIPREPPEPLSSSQTSQNRPTLYWQPSGRGRASARVLAAHRQPGGYTKPPSARQVPRITGPWISSGSPPSEQATAQPSSPSFSFGRQTTMGASLDSSQGVSGPLADIASFGRLLHQPGEPLSPTRSVSPSSPSSPSAQINLNFNVPRSSLSLSPPRSSSSKDPPQTNSPHARESDSRHSERGRSLHYCSHHYPPSRSISAPPPCYSSAYIQSADSGEQQEQEGEATVAASEGQAEMGEDRRSAGVQVQIDIAETTAVTTTAFRHPPPTSDCSPTQRHHPSRILPSLPGIAESQTLSSSTQTIAAGTHVDTPRFATTPISPSSPSPPTAPRSAVVDVNLNISTGPRPTGPQPRAQKREHDGEERRRSAGSTSDTSEEGREGARRDWRRRNGRRKRAMRGNEKEKNRYSSTDETDEDIMPPRGLSTSSRLLPKSPHRMLPRPAGLAAARPAEMGRGQPPRAKSEAESSQGDIGLLRPPAAIPADMLPEEWEEKLRKVSERLQRRRMTSQSG